MREIIWTTTTREVLSLIPRRRGEGWLRVPAGHHMTPFIERVQRIPGVVDVYGLDGFLEIEVPDYIVSDQTATRIMDALARIENCTHRQSDVDFWRIVETFKNSALRRAEEGK